MTWRLGHRPGLDGLRGVAVLLVIAGHVEHRFTTGGAVGVTVFFVLSGFLITALLLGEKQTTGRVSLRGFYLRRARRLLPALGLFLVIIGAVQAVLGIPARTLVPVALYFGNWVAAAHGQVGMMKHTWSLSVEEQFYFLWPLVLLAAFHWGGRRAVAWAALAGVAVSVAARFALWDGGDGAVRVRFGSDTNAAGLLLGCALGAWMMAQPAERPNRPRVALAGVLALVALSVPSSMTHYTLLAPPVAMLITVGLIWCLAQTGSGGAFAHPVLVGIGRRSYGWYLWHAPFIILASRTANTTASRLVGVVFAVGVAELSWRYLEQPVMRHGRRYAVSHQSQSSASVPASEVNQN